MRIGMLADVYKPHISGVTHYISQNKKALEQWRHKVYVFTLGNESFEDDELYVVRSPAIPLADTGYNLGFRYSRLAQRKLASMDVAHVHHPFISGQLAIRYCRRRNIPVVFTNHTRYDLYAQAYLPMMPGALSESFLQVYMPNFCAACDMVIAPSAGLVKVLRSFGVESPVEVIPNGIDLAPFQTVAEAHARAELGLADRDRVLIYVGRLAPEKNLTFLMRAFVGAQSAVENLHLLLVGDGPEADNLRDRAALAGVGDRVHFLGAVPYETVPGLLKLADAFVTASLTEVHPLSLIEALTAGLPALGIASPGIEDTIIDGANGFLCPNDIAAFTGKLTRLMLDDELRRRFAAGAAASAAQYDVRITAAALLACYERVIEARPRQPARPDLGQQLRDLLT
ncbi:MAG: glycosyltransferase [Chloroflexi bacterium]|nr:glycosyltransferase [Chloroflexota bacterium]